MDLFDSFVECYICKDQESKEYVFKCQCSLYYHRSCALEWSIEINEIKDIESNDYVCPQCNKKYISRMKKFNIFLFWVFVEIIIIIIYQYKILYLLPVFFIILSMIAIIKRKKLLRYIAEI